MYLEIYCMDKFKSLNEARMNGGARCYFGLDNHSVDCSFSNGVPLTMLKGITMAADLMDGGYAIKAYLYKEDGSMLDSLELRSNSNLSNNENLALKWGATPASDKCSGIVRAFSDVEVIQCVGNGKHVVWSRSFLSGDALRAGEKFHISKGGEVRAAALCA